MFFSTLSHFIAGLRLHIVTFLLFWVFFFVNSTAAREEKLFTSSVSYCAPPESLLIQRFSITYFAANASVSFNISAASVEPDVRVSANLLLNVYGTQPLNLTLDLCDGSVLRGALCPLPTYNFTGSDEIRLDGLVDVGEHVPGIAYKVPDLEAFAQLTLTEVGTGKVKACVQSTLANGWSTYQPPVSYSTGALTIVALLSSLYHSTVSPESIAPFRLLDLIGLFQTIAVSGLLDLNYPLVYRSFTLNFAWALGLFSASANSRIQNSIDNMRHKTGGRMPDANGGSAVDLVNRRLSPYNIVLATKVSAADFDLVNPYDPSSQYTSLSFLSKAESHDADPAVHTVTQNSANVLDAGIPLYVNSIGIATANAFMSAFITMLILLAIFVGVAAIGWAGVWAWGRWKKDGQGGEKGGTGSVSSGSKADEWKVYYPWWVRSWAVRISLAVLTPLTLFPLYQFTLAARESWLSTFLAVITLIVLSASILYPAYLTIQLVHRTGRAWTLYTHTEHVMSYGGALYVQYRPTRWWFFFLALALVVFRSVVVAFGFANGLAQVVLLLISEVGLFGAIVALKPHETRGGDILAGTLSFTRLALVVLLFPFVESFRIRPIARVVVGFIAIVLCAVVVIVMAINAILNLGIQRVWEERVKISRRRSTSGLTCCGIVFGVGWGTRLSSQRSESDRSSMKSGNVSASELEKGAVIAGSESTLRAIPTKRRSLDGEADSDPTSRPENPTPSQHVPLDPIVNKPYPDVTPTPTTATTTESWEYSVSIPSPLPSGSGFPSASTSRSSASYAYYSYASPLQSPSEMPNSASASSATHGTMSSLGDELPRRNEFEGLGLHPPVEEEDEDGTMLQREVEESGKAIIGVRSGSPQSGSSISDSDARTFGRPSESTVRASDS